MMELDPQDVAVIGQRALREGMNSGIDYQKIIRYREVLEQNATIPPRPEHAYS